MSMLFRVWPCEHCGRVLENKGRELKLGVKMTPSNMCVDCKRLTTSNNWFAWSWPAKRLIEGNFDLDELREFRKDPHNYVIKKINPELRRAKSETIVISKEDGHIALTSSVEQSKGA